MTATLLTSPSNAPAAKLCLRFFRVGQSGHPARSNGRLGILRLRVFTVIFVDPMQVLGRSAEQANAALNAGLR